MQKIMKTQVSDVLRTLNNDGWLLTWQQGYLRQYAHRAKPGLVMVAGELNDVIDPKTLSSILKQANLISSYSLPLRKRFIGHGKKYHPPF